jgi:hypothetical protein
MVSKEWVQATRTYFLDFLHTTGFPDLPRHGGWGLMCAYPEWLIMLIGVLAVKCKEKTYMSIHGKCGDKGHQGMSGQALAQSRSRGHSFLSSLDSSPVAKWFHRTPKSLWLIKTDSYRGGSISLRPSNLTSRNREWPSTSLQTISRIRYSQRDL